MRVTQREEERCSRSTIQKEFGDGKTTVVNKKHRGTTSCSSRNLTAPPTVRQYGWCVVAHARRRRRGGALPSGAPLTHTRARRVAISN